MLVNLRALFGVFVDILLLRRGPEHLPASAVLLGIVVAVDIILYSLVDRLFVRPVAPQLATSFPQMVAGALLTLLTFRIALHLANKSERFVQTMTAMFAANTMTVPALPLAAALIQYTGKPGGEPAPILLLMMGAVAGIWMIAVLVYIVKSAFEWSWLQAALMLVASNIGIAILLGLIFGESPKPP
jgi:hypothetical protein